MYTVYILTHNYLPQNPMILRKFFTSGYLFDSESLLRMGDIADLAGVINEGSL
jgi:hypothetical protein